MRDPKEGFKSGERHEVQVPLGLLFLVLARMLVVNLEMGAPFLNTLLLVLGGIYELQIDSVERGGRKNRKFNVG